MTKPERRLSMIIAFELALVAGLAIGARLWFMAFTGITYEDSLISLRYAQNFASGLGLVYNPGERVFGATTPLYVLLLSALSALRLPDPLAHRTWVSPRLDSSARDSAPWRWVCPHGAVRGGRQEVPTVQEEKAGQVQGEAAGWDAV